MTFQPKIRYLRPVPLSPKKRITFETLGDYDNAITFDSQNVDEEEARQVDQDVSEVDRSKEGTFYNMDIKRAEADESEEDVDKEYEQKSPKSDIFTDSENDDETKKGETEVVAKIISRI